MADPSPKEPSGWELFTVAVWMLMLGLAARLGLRKGPYS